jgi:hypothetical protein
MRTKGKAGGSSSRIEKGIKGEAIYSQGKRTPGLRIWKSQLDESRRKDDRKCT